MFLIYKEDSIHHNYLKHSDISMLVLVGCETFLGGGGGGGGGRRELEACQSPRLPFIAVIKLLAIITVPL